MLWFFLHDWSTERWYNKLRHCYWKRCKWEELTRKTKRNLECRLYLSIDYNLYKYASWRRQGIKALSSQALWEFQRKSLDTKHQPFSLWRTSSGRQVFLLTYSCIYINRRPADYFLGKSGYKKPKSQNNTRLALLNRFLRDVSPSQK